jgi:transcriptional regulator with XRE-family HTH domain
VSGRRSSLELGLLALEDRTLPSNVSPTGIVGPTLGPPPQPVLDANAVSALVSINPSAAPQDNSAAPDSQAIIPDDLIGPSVDPTTGQLVDPSQAGGSDNAATVTDGPAAVVSPPSNTTAAYAYGATAALPTYLAPDYHHLSRMSADTPGANSLDAAAAVLTIPDHLLNANQLASSNDGTGLAAGQGLADGALMQNPPPAVCQAAVLGTQGLGADGGAGACDVTATNPAVDAGSGPGTLSKEAVLDLGLLAALHSPLSTKQNAGDSWGAAETPHRDSTGVGSPEDARGLRALDGAVVAPAAPSPMSHRVEGGPWQANPPGPLPSSLTGPGPRERSAASRGVKRRQRRVRKGTAAVSGCDHAMRVASYVVAFTLLSAVIERRAEALALRAQGLSLREIGRRLGGLSRQAVSYLLNKAGSGQSQGVRCSACGAAITARCFRRRTVGDALCRTCLARHPGASFALSLRSLRLAAGWSRTDLASAASVTDERIKAFEEGTTQPHRLTRSRLAKALGAPELEPGDEREVCPAGPAHATLQVLQVNDLSFDRSQAS